MWASTLTVESLQTSSNRIGNDSLKLAVVIGPPSYRKPQETQLFDGCQHFRTVFITASEEPIKPQAESGQLNVSIKKIVPDFLLAPFVRKPYSPVSFIRLSRLERVLGDADVVNCIELYSLISRQTAEAIYEKKSKLVVSVFETIPKTPVYQAPPFRGNLKVVLRRADLVLAYTNRARECLLNMGAEEGRVTTLYPGIDLKIFYPAVEERRDVSVRVLFVGGMAGEKGLRVLATAFESLDVGGAELWICARNLPHDTRFAIQRLSRRRTVRVLGDVDHRAIPSVYRQCDIFCLPSIDKRRLGVKVWEEQFGFALVEAMASGLPVVASNCGAIPEIAGPKNLIVPQGSPEELKEGLTRLIEDSKLRRAIGNSNRSRSEEMFDLVKQREKLDRVLLKLFS